jgi:hypothetical protein
MNEERLDKMQRRAESVFGWGTPLGLASVLAALGFFLLCLHWSGILR